MGNHYTYANKSVVDIHAAPNPMSEIVSQAIYGSEISILREKETWKCIQTADGYQGWIKGEEMITKNSPYPSTQNIAQVEALWTHVCWVDDTTPHPPAVTLPFEAKVEIPDDFKDFHRHWIPIRLVDGKSAWVQSGDLRVDPKFFTIDEMVEFSKRFLGIPYKWGGNSSFGFDCSSFVQMLYRQVGISLPRDSVDQTNVSFAKQVPEEEFLRGDLLFMGSHPPQISHVGMYLGNGKFIHSVTTNKSGPHVIQICDFHDPEWQEKYITARRYNLS
ncbi:MAG: Gamma-D-glutamyl-L-lysine endopeptidase [Chlamydiae bacterium]|nr:Gamma-D-glutamyl-L-lysine endopeptidase [Chlamydiota bacterium]